MNIPVLAVSRGQVYECNGFETLLSLFLMIEKQPCDFHAITSRMKLTDTLQAAGVLHSETFVPKEERMRRKLDWVELSHWSWIFLIALSQSSPRSLVVRRFTCKFLFKYWPNHMTTLLYSVIYYSHLRREIIFSFNTLCSCMRTL